MTTEQLLKMSKAEVIVFATQFLGRPVKGTKKAVIAAIEKRRSDDVFDSYRCAACKRAPV